MAGLQRAGPDQRLHLTNDSVSLSFYKIALRDKLLPSTKVLEMCTIDKRGP